MGDTMATRYATASYSEVYDTKTEAGQSTVIGIHTPISEMPQKMLFGFFAQFKKFRYVGCDVTFIPTSTLPADPLQISYEAGEPTIDPRDMVNPILYKGTHGSSLGNVLNRLLNNPEYNTGNFGSSLDITRINADQPLIDSDDLTSLYYQGLSDSSWGKAHVQRGFTKKGLYPLTYALGTQVQIMPHTNYVDGFLTGGGDAIPNYNARDPSDPSIDAPLNPDGGSTKSGDPNLFTIRTMRLGWLDTVQHASGIPSAWSPDQLPPITTLPKLMMMVILLPPAYKTEFYFRIVLRHRFEFRDFVNAVGPDRAGNQALVPAWLNEPNAAAAAASLDVMNATVDLRSSGVA